MPLSRGHPSPIVHSKEQAHFSSQEKGNVVYSEDLFLMCYICSYAKPYKDMQIKSHGVMPLLNREECGSHN